MAWPMLRVRTMRVTTGTPYSRAIAAASRSWRSPSAVSSTSGALIDTFNGTSIGYRSTSVVSASAASRTAVAVITSSTRSFPIGIRIERYSTSTAGPISVCGARTVTVSGRCWVRR